MQAIIETLFNLVLRLVIHDASRTSLLQQSLINYSYSQKDLEFIGNKSGDFTIISMAISNNKGRPDFGYGRTRAIL